MARPACFLRWPVSAFRCHDFLRRAGQISRRSVFAVFRQAFLQKGRQPAPQRTVPIPRAAAPQPLLLVPSRAAALLSSASCTIPPAPPDHLSIAPPRQLFQGQPVAVGNITGIALSVRLGPPDPVGTLPLFHAGHQRVGPRRSACLADTRVDIVQ